MKVKVLYFAQVAEKVGVPSEEIELETGSNSEELIDILINKYPEIKALTYNVAVNQQLTRSAVELYDNVEVALLPPFAGG